MNKPTLLILAAGMGSRYGSLKQIDKFGPSGESIIEYSIYDAIRAGFGKVVFVIRESMAADFNEVLIQKIKGKIETEMAFQELNVLPEGFTLPADRVKPWGTAHAILCAESKINEPFAVINADDFYGREAYSTLADFLTSLNPENKNEYSMVGYQINNTLSEFGYVSRGVCTVDENQYLTGVVERTQIEKIDNKIMYKDENGDLKELTGNETVSMNFWGFTPSFFDFLKSGFSNFLKANINNPKSEYYIPTEANNIIQNRLGKLKVLTSSAKWFGVTYKEDKTTAIERIKDLVDKGVYPANLWA